MGIHATGFRDFLLKPELLRAIVDCGFEHPSEGNTEFRCNSAARVYPAGDSGYGRALPGQVGYGQDGRVCACYAAAN